MFFGHFVLLPLVWAPGSLLLLLHFLSLLSASRHISNCSYSCPIGRTFAPQTRLRCATLFKRTLTSPHMWPFLAASSILSQFGASKRPPTRIQLTSGRPVGKENFGLRHWFCSCFRLCRCRCRCCCFFWARVSVALTDKLRKSISRRHFVRSFPFAWRHHLMPLSVSHTYARRR